MLNRIAAAQNYTTKEGFPMRSVAFKALAVLVGLAVLMIAAPGWRSETAQTQTSAARAELTINGGCNYLPITLGTLTNFRVQITYLDLRIFPNGQADFALVLQGPQGTFTFGNDPNAQPNLLGLRVGDVRYFNSQGVLQGLGWRTLSLLVDVNPDPAAVQYQLVVRCYYQGVNGPPGTSETQVTIQARTSQGPLNGVPIGFFYDPLQNGPATNGATTFFTPYTENFPKGMRIRLRAEDQVVVEGITYRFIRWEFRDDPWGTFCYLSRGAVVECVLGYPLNSIAFTAVYEPEQQPPPPGGRITCMANPPGQLVVYRLFHPRKVDHFYTQSCDEANYAMTVGWSNFEGIPFAVFAPGTPNTVPFRRFWNGRQWDHHYTASPEEAQSLLKNGWVEEGPLGNIALTQLPGTVPLYRLARPGDDHMFTTNWNEVLSAQGCCGYRYEGIAGYVIPLSP
jgi:hypothetical protein